MADPKFRLCIVTPTKYLYDDKVEMVIMRTSEGDLGVLSGHIPLTTALAYGILDITVTKDEERKMTLFGGFAEVTPEGVTILTDAAEKPEDIDTARASAAKERAEERLRSRPENLDVLRAELALRRALLRIEASEAVHQKRA